MQLSSELMDGLVLALLQREDQYGYSLTKQVQARFNVSESAMYPVLRRLKNKDFLETYDEAFEGRNRRYYRISAQGQLELARIKSDWTTFMSNINSVMEIGGMQDAE